MAVKSVREYNPVYRQVAPVVAKKTPEPQGAVPLLRREIGEVLRSLRQSQGRTLREVSARARVSLGYLSEVERGQKEASSELLASICEALEVPLWLVMRDVSERIALAEGVVIPDTVPDEMVRRAALGR
ncbi:helix-turn-helix domain-containing protein [Actinomycetaceae bacterium TAE3-ERU4]|nr:helix-turn-helix domain-containing protein [Actinomycetaceae bacterium TAE3-ERU4]